MLLLYVFSLRIAEKLHSHSQEVVGNVARSLKATFLFSNPEKETYFKVSEMLVVRQPVNVVR